MMRTIFNFQFSIFHTFSIRHLPFSSTAYLPLPVRGSGSSRLCLVQGSRGIVTSNQQPETRNEVPQRVLVPSSYFLVPAPERSTYGD